MTLGTDSYRVAGLESGAEYKVQVRARYDGDVEDGLWSAVSRRTVTAPSTPAKEKVQDKAVGRRSTDYDKGCPERDGCRWHRRLDSGRRESG